MKTSFPLQSEESVLANSLARVLLWVGLFVAGFAAMAGAGCPHCQSIVEVSVHLKNGTIHHGYFEHHDEDLPPVDVPGGRTVIPLAELPTDYYPERVIRILDTVVVISGLGKFSSPASIDSIAVNDVDEMVIDRQLTPAAADRVHFLDWESIGELASPDVIRFDTLMDLSMFHFVSLNDSVTIKQLRWLAQNRNLIGYSQDHSLRHLSVQVGNLQRLEDSRFADYLTEILTRKLSDLKTRQRALESLAGDGFLGHQFTVIKDHVSRWITFVEGVITYLRDNDRPALAGAIAEARKRGGLPGDLDEHPYDVKGELEREGITYLIQSYTDRNLIADDLGEDYDRYLNDHGVYVIEQAVD